jgi:hypothetical protein
MPFAANALSKLFVPWLLLALLIVPLAACGGSGRDVDLSYDTGAGTVVVEADSAGGFVPEAFVQGHIPGFRLYGDGRVIWAEPAGRGEAVHDGHLAPQEMEELLAWIAERGFFEMDDSYTVENAPTDMASDCVRVKLAAQEKRVCEYFDGAPEAFGQIHDRLRAGAGASNVGDYQPQIGWAVAEPLTWDSGAEVIAWPESLAPALPALAGGHWVEGETLDFLWRHRLAQGPFMVYQASSDQYIVVLQVPDLMTQAPPAP